MNRTIRAIGCLAIVASTFALSGYVIKETKQDEDFSIYVNDGGTMKQAIKVTGSTGAVTLGASGETGTQSVNAGTFSVNAPTNTDSIFTLNENGTTKWFLFNESDNDSLNIFGSASAAFVTAAGGWTIGPATTGAAHSSNGSFTVGLAATNSEVNLGTVGEKTLSLGASGNEGAHIVGKTSAASTNRPLSITAMGNDGQAAGDMIFDVREHDNTGYATTTSDAYRFRHNAATLMSGTRSGAWTFGTAQTFNYNPPFHTVNGAIQSGGTGSGDEAKYFWIGANAYTTNNGGSARTTGLGGAALIMDTRTTDSGNAFLFNTNLVSDGATTASVTKGTATHTGSWTLGDVSTATTSAITHQFRNGNNSSTNGVITLAIESGNQGTAGAILKIRNSTGASNDIFQMAQGGGVMKFRDGADAHLGEVDISNKQWNFGITSALASGQRVGVANDDSGNTPAMRILNNDTTADTSTIVMRVDVPGDADATGARLIGFVDGNAFIGSIDVASAASVVYNTTSDRRLKKDIRDYQDGLTFIRDVRPRRFKWIEGGAADVGFIAQELRLVAPEAVSGDETGDPAEAPMQVDYARVTPHLAAGMKALLQKVEKLERRVEYLEAACQ